MAGNPTDESAVESTLQQAVGHHQAGNLPEAERLYRAILAAEPAQADANHNLGVLALQSRRAVESLPYLATAVNAGPNRAQYWLSYIAALLQAGRREEAGDALFRARQRGTNGEAIDALAAQLETLARGRGQPAFALENWIPDLSGDRYVSVLERLHATLRPKTYLEIGVETGATLALSRCASIGIDPAFQFQQIAVVQQVLAKPSLLLYQMPSDDFFARFNPITLLGAPLDFAFLDGMHRCEYLLRDFLNTERHCNPESVIALHDCLPVELPMAERTPNSTPIDPRRKGMWTGDAWRAALLLKRRRPTLRIAVLDAAPTGLVLLTNLEPSNKLLAKSLDRYVEEMMSWSLEKITLAGYYQEMGVTPEFHFRHPDEIRTRLGLAS